MAISIGSWGTPELGITEAIGGLLGRGRTAQGGSNILGNNKQAAGSVLGTGTQAIYGPTPNQSSFTPPSTQNVTNTGSGRSSGGVSGVGYNFPQPTSPNTPFAGAGSQIDSINNEFNQFNSYLDSQESSLNQNFNETKGFYDTQKANLEGQYNTEKTNQTEGIKKTEALNLAKVRQLLGDLQQGNAARTAISGGGSVSEVLGERFGREAQSRVGNVMDQTQQALTRVNDFYNTKISELNERYQANVLQAKQTLDNSIGQIRQARTQSASAKQNATVDAWRGYYDQLNQAKVAAEQYKMQLDMWNQQNSESLAAIQPFNQENAQTYNTGIGQSFSELPQAPGLSTSQNPMAMNPQYRVKSRKTPDDQQYWQDQYGFTPNYQQTG